MFESAGAGPSNGFLNSEDDPPSDERVASRSFEASHVPFKPRVTVVFSFSRRFLGSRDYLPSEGPLGSRPFESSQALKPTAPFTPSNPLRSTWPFTPSKLLKPRATVTPKPADPTGTFARTATVKPPAETAAPPIVPKDNGLGEGDGADSGSGSLWAGVGGAVAGIGLIAALILIVFLKRRKQDTSIVVTEDDPDEGTSTETLTWAEHDDDEFIEEENPYASSGDATAEDDFDPDPDEL
jgi:hypothetical protein